MKIVIDDVAKAAVEDRAIVVSSPEVEQLAYKIAMAIQDKIKNKLVNLKTQRLCTGRKVFCYALIDDKGVGETAYTEGFFEDNTKENGTWLAKRIASEIVQRHGWACKGSKK